jgi:alkylation response protein AidB-like acyl-CoA dehydrogenase
MDVRLSSEQVELRDTVARAVARIGPRTVADLDDHERGRALDAAVTAAGWRELRAASERGQPWGSAVDAALVAVELGQGVADTPFLGPTLAADLRRLAGASPATGPETLILLADLSAPGEADNGALPWDMVAVDAQRAGQALVLANSAAGLTLGSVELDGQVGGADLTRPSAFLRTGTRVSLVPHDEPIFESDIVRWHSLGLALTCADLVGVMRGAVTLATRYAKDRRQYGAAIGSFQAVQHLLADAFVLMEGSASIALHAAWAVDALEPGESFAAASAAKAFCARSARTVCETAIQVHGGIGNTWECLAHIYLRRALLSGEVLGGVGASLARVLHAHEIGMPDGFR